jgi:hypothetical protein
MAVILVNIYQALFLIDNTDDAIFHCDLLILQQRSQIYGGALRDRAWDPIQMRHTR